MSAAPDAEEEHASWYRSRRKLGALSLTVLLFVAALHLGGGAAASVAVSAPLAMLSLLVAGVSPGAHRRDPLAYAALLFIGITALQLAPWSPSMLRAIDPQIAEWSALGLAPFQIDKSAQWRPLHVDPGNGLIDLQYAIGLFAAYLAAARVARRGEGALLLKGAASVTVVIASIGFFHKLGQIDRLFGMYQPVETSAPPLLTPLINQNHLSNFLGIGCVLSIGLAASAESVLARAGLALMALVCGVGSALSFSRAGIASTIGASVMLIAWMTRRESARRRGVSRQQHARSAMTAAAATGLALTVMLFLAWTPLQNIHTRTDTTKLTMIRYAARVVTAHPWIGLGSGSYYAAFTADGREAGVITAERAESMPVDLALAVGPIFALVILALWIVGLWRVRPMRKAPLWVLGASCALLAAAAHNLLDFSLWLGATGYLVAVIAGVLKGESSREDSTQHWAAPWVALALAAALVAWMSPRTARSAHFVDRALLAQQVRARGDVLGALRPALERHPADAWLSLVAARWAVRSARPIAGRLINQSMRLAPRWPSPHELIAVHLARTGYRRQALLEARLAIGESTGQYILVPELLVSLNATQEELEYAVPDTDKGVVVLRTLASTRLGAIANALMLRRHPDDVDTLLRIAAVQRLDPTTAAQAKTNYQRILDRHPENTTAAQALAQLLINNGEIDQAERLLTRTHVLANNLELYSLLASIYVRRSNTEGMRRTMAQWLERVGGDFDERARVLATLGERELELGNYGAALTAFDQADLTSSGDHPYLARIVETAARSGDIPRWRGACARLRELTDPDDARRRACDSTPGTHDAGVD